MGVLSAKCSHPCQTLARWSQEDMRGLPSCSTDLRTLAKASSNPNCGLQNCLDASQLCSHSCFWVDVNSQAHVSASSTFAMSFCDQLMYTFPLGLCKHSPAVGLEIWLSSCNKGMKTRVQSHSLQVINKQTNRYWAWWSMPIMLTLENGDRQILGTHWPAHLAKLVTSRFSE